MASTLDTGCKAEQFVCDRLIERGMRVTARNVREKFSEIDIVALEGDTICFVEVRSRKNTCLGHPLETISLKKQKSVRRAAEAYLVKRNLLNSPVRFDVATVVWSTGEFLYIENAF